MATQEELLQEVINRLDQVIAILKLANQEAIERTWERIKKDDVSKSLLELSDGTLESGELQKRVTEATKKSTRTVQYKIGELVQLGALRSIRKGAKIYYQKSELFT